jgi:hypothetical protein
MTIQALVVATDRATASPDVVVDSTQPGIADSASREMKRPVSMS